MAETLKRLGATVVVADTDTELGGPGASTTWVLSHILVVNQGDTDRTFRVAHVDGDLADVATEDYVAYDYPIEARGFVPITVGMCIDAGHTLLVRSSSANVNFIAWGSELT